MRTYSSKPRDLNMGRLLVVFAVISCAFLALLAVAPVRPYFAEWRRVQSEYNRLAAASGQPTIPIEVRQIWKPALGVTDRCVTCHLGMGAATPLPGNRLSATHPPVPHDIREFGCTVCHGGQGRATTKQDAHGFVSHWDEQILEAQHLPAGCGTCHDRLPTATRAQLVRGSRLVESLDCLSCHKVDGRGRGNAADLTVAGLKGFNGEWHQDHLARRARAETPEWISSYGDIPEADVAVIQVFLKTRVGASRVVEANALAMERGCLGCHKLGGRGGDEGPALDVVGRKPVGDLDFTRVSGPETLTNYMRTHLADPAGVVPGSQMPQQTFTAEELDLLTTWVLFLRSRDVPTNYLPKDRLRRSVLNERPAQLSGAQAYGAYCSACHGTHGEGRSFATLSVRFPAIGTADFLDVADDEFIGRTLMIGRPGRRMPALAAHGGTIAPGELMDLVQHVRSLGPVAPSVEAVAAAAASAETGAAIYAADCASCHGPAGEGTTLGSPLAATDSPARVGWRASYGATANGVLGTVMPAYRAYDAPTLRSVLEHVAQLRPVATRQADWRLGRGDAAAGERLFGRACSGCHGVKGEGAVGPALANSGFQQAAGAHFIAMTIVRGRAGTPMPAFGRDNLNYARLTADDVLDVTAYVKSLGETRVAATR